jgi:hypothetical protein
LTCPASTSAASFVRTLPTGGDELYEYGAN